jgi:hypothetical protein
MFIARKIAGDVSGSQCSGDVSCRELLLEVGGVLLDEFFLFLRHILKGMDRVGGASGYACAAVDAALGINVHLSRGLKSGLVLLGMDAVGRADLNTEGIFYA